MARIVGCRPGATRPGDDDRPVARRPWYVACFWSRVTTAPPALRLRLLVGAAASLLLFGAVRPAVAAQTADEVLGQRVAGAIRSYARYTIFDEVTVHVEDQHVTLTGRVTVPVKKQEIGERVARIEGIRSLTNDIAVLPASVTDDRLRRAVAAAVYGHPGFRRYAESPHPSIHIIIEHARVTLVGEVDRHGDRILAQSLAHVPGVLSVENRLRVADR